MNDKNVASLSEVDSFLSDEIPKPEGAPSIDPSLMASGDEADEWLKLEERKEKYGSTGSQILTGLEGAASAATFGLSTGLQTALGADPEAIRERREENPGAYMTGQAAGLIGSLALPGAGAAGALSKAGNVAAKAAGLGQATTVSARVSSAAVKSAVENLLFQAGDEVSKALSLDPNQSLQTAAANVGLSSLIGAGVGGAVGAVSPLWELTAGKRIKGLLNDVANEANMAVEVAENGGRLKSAISPQDGLQEPGLLEMAAGLKPNADEISQAAKRLGAEPTAGTLSNAEFIGRLEDGLIKRPTIYGQKAAKETDRLWQKLNKAGSETLKGATNKTEAEVGREVKGGLVEALEAEYKPIAARYEKLKPHMQAMEVAPELKQRASQNILAHELVAVAPDSDAGLLAQRIAKEIGNLKNVDQIKSYRTLINERVGKAVRAGGEELPILRAAKNELTALREAAIEDAARRTGIGKEAGSISSQTIQEVREADALYRGYKERVLNLGREAGLGNTGDVRTLLEKFKRLPDEAFATKIFDAGDINQLKFFKDKFPKQFELARSYKLKEIGEKSIDEGQGKNGKFSVGKYLRQLSDTKMNPEAREILLGENLQKFLDVKTLFQALPENFNPSGTAAAMDYNQLFNGMSLAGAVKYGFDNVADGIKYAILKGLPQIHSASQSESSKAAGLATMLALGSEQQPSSVAFKAAADYIAKIIKGETLVNQAAKNVFIAGKETLPSRYVPDDKKLEKLDKKLQELQTDSTPLLKSGGDVGYYMPAHTEALGFMAGNAVAYLNSIRPENPKGAPLDEEIPLSSFQKENYFDALQIAEQPLVVLERVKNGSIDSESLEHLQAIYPSLYEKLRQKLTDQVIEASVGKIEIPYKTRLGLSIFLGEPLDSTMTPQAIQATQMVQVMPESQQAPMGAPSGPRRGTMKDIGKVASASLTPEQARVMSRSKV